MRLSQVCVVQISSKFLKRNTVNDRNFRNKVARMEGNYKLG